MYTFLQKKRNYSESNIPGVSESFDKMYMTRGQGQWPRLTGKTGFWKVAFLLKKSDVNDNHTPTSSDPQWVCPIELVADICNAGFFLAVLHTPVILIGSLNYRVKILNFLGYSGIVVHNYTSNWYFYN